MSADYVPYGPEWEAELMKHRKQDLVAMLRRAYTKEGAPSAALNNRAAMAEQAEPAASLPCPSCGKPTATTITFTLWQCSCGAVFDEDQATEASK